jgi:hypothetical protein
LIPFFARAIPCGSLVHVLTGEKKVWDIDLFIETSERNSALVLKRKIAFLGILQVTLGEQKIDIVIKQPISDQSQLIFNKAKNNVSN